MFPHLSSEAAPAAVTSWAHRGSRRSLIVLLGKPSAVAVFSILAGIQLSGCGSLTSQGEQTGFTGEWCTYRSLGGDGLPLTAVSFIGMTLLREGDRVLGTGTTKRAGDTIIWASRYRGEVVGSRLVMEVSDIPGGGQEEAGPHFTLLLEAEGRQDLVGTTSGDPGFDGSIRLVRLSVRCFGQ
jgi:hypothetical protein